MFKSEQRRHSETDLETIDLNHIDLKVLLIKDKGFCMIIFFDYYGFNREGKDKNE